MKWLRNDEHGVIQAVKLTDVQKKNGWYEITEAELNAYCRGDGPTDLSAMTKAELEVYARDFNIELDRRMTKENMLKDFNEKLGE